MITGGPTVVAIGNFDGVHLGHREVLAAARATRPGAPLVAVTFWPHPMVVLRPDAAPELLCDLAERIDLLRHAGADEVRVVEFTRRVADWSPQEFVEHVLAPLHPAKVVVGENFRFGRRALGTVDTLRELGAGTFEVVVLPLVSDVAALSSTRVRHSLAVGDVEAAAGVLGRPFRYTGIVVMGDQRGRTLGYPTANLTVPEGHACPADGVYAGWLTCLEKADAEPMPAAISVGTNPTFDGVERRVETYVLDRTDLELYGCRIGVDFITRLRGQVKFDSLDDLIVQMDADVAAAREVLGATPPQN
ncbi:MAG TPA: bifunctional riboflavin kinase/FAD synthetase [Coriobacteriia bacterium]